MEFLALKWFAFSSLMKHLTQGRHSPAIPANSCDSCEFLQKFLHFAVVSGIQLSFSTNLFDIYILIIYLKVLIFIFLLFHFIFCYRNLNFRNCTFFWKKVGLRNFVNFFFIFFANTILFCILTYKDIHMWKCI